VHSDRDSFRPGSVRTQIGVGTALRIRDVGGSL
jgi:hypothetical protein